MVKKFHRRKRNYLVNKDLQGKLGLQYLLLTIAGLLGLGMLFASSLSNHLTISYDDNLVEVGSTPRVLLGELLRHEGFFLLLGGLLIILITIILTHKIAGPIYRFEQTVKAMCERKLDQRIHLRKGDEGQKLGSLINELNLLLCDDIRQIREGLDRLADSDEKKQLLKITELYQLPTPTDQPGR